MVQNLYERLKTFCLKMLENQTASVALHSTLQLNILLFWFISVSQICDIIM